MRTIKNYEKKPRGTPLFPCSVYHIDSTYPDYVMPFHWHTEYEMIVIRRGTVDFSINDTPVTASENDVVFVSDGMLHGGTPRGDSCVYDCLVFAPEFLPKASFSEILDKILTGAITVDTYIEAASHPDISESALRLCDAFIAASESADELILRGLTIALIGKMIKSGCFTTAPQKPNRHIGQFKAVLSYVEKNYPEKITLDDLADAAGVTSKYLCRSFSSLTGKTPIEYLNEYRIDCACELLRSTDRTLVDIAGACGFGDQSYFIRLFKRVKNTTPRTYRLGHGK